MPLNQNYLNTLKERAKKCRVHRKFQLTGLSLAQLLNDEKHKSLFIKLAQKFNEEELLSLAKNVAERPNIKNKGAYFMKIWQGNELKRNPKPAENSAKK